MRTPHRTETNDGPPLLSAVLGFIYSAVFFSGLRENDYESNVPVETRGDFNSECSVGLIRKMHRERKVDECESDKKQSKEEKIVISDCGMDQLQSTSLAPQTSDHETLIISRHVE